MSGERWIRFSEAADRLHAKYGSSENAAKALRMKAMTGAIASIAGTAVELNGVDLMGKGSSVAANHRNWPIPLDAWQATKEPNIVEKGWRLCSFTAILGDLGSARKSIVMADISLDRAEIEKLDDLPDVRLTLEGQMERGVGAFAPLAERIATPRPTASSSISNIGTATQVAAAKPKGGRPPKPFWEDAYIELARQLYVGELIPKTQADIEKAIADWLSSKDLILLRHKGAGGALALAQHGYRAIR